MSQRMGVSDRTIRNNAEVGWSCRSRDIKEKRRFKVWPVSNLSDAAWWTVETGCFSESPAAFLNLYLIPVDWAEAKGVKLEQNSTAD